MSDVGVDLICPEHRLMLERVPEAKLSREQRWCGIWWKCPDCHHSVLFGSAELDAQLRAQTEQQLTLPEGA